MSVKPKHVRKSIPAPAPFLVAADILKGDHPLYAVFTAWLDGQAPTKRQARKFLAAHSQYLLGVRAA